MQITKADRQARRTTDPRLVDTIIDPDAPGGTLGLLYKCRGCGKTSKNGGSFGFHVRACRELDRLQLDNLRIAEIKGEAVVAGKRDELEAAAVAIFAKPLDQLGAQAVETVRDFVIDGDGPRKHREIMSGHEITCRNCGGDLWWYAGRTLHNHNLTCATPGCLTQVAPLTETGASQ